MPSSHPDLPGDHWPAETDRSDATTAGASEPTLVVPRSGSSLRRLFRGQALRWGALFIALIPLGLMATASRLEPSSAGLGTHQQLGLPPCSMRVIFGIRCPSCGMTTSWAYFVRGRWLSSIRVNAGGFLLACLSLAVAALALRTYWLGRLPSLQTQKIVTISGIGIAGITLIDWIARLAL